MYSVCVHFGFRNFNVCTGFDLCQTDVPMELSEIGSTVIECAPFICEIRAQPPTPIDIENQF